MASEERTSVEDRAGANQLDGLFGPKRAGWAQSEQSRVRTRFTFTFRRSFNPVRPELRGMAQTTLDDDDLFSEAASEMREDVESSLEQARAALPAADDIWDIEADNTLAALNTLNSALDVGDAAEHLRDAKKWYTMGEQADAFDDAEDLAAEIDELETLVTDVEAASEQASSLASTIPEVKNALEDAEDGTTDG